MAPAFTVHYLAPGTKEFPCQQKPNPRLLGLDYVSTWTKVHADLYVTCFECLMFRPPDWKINASKKHFTKKSRY